MRIGLRWSLLIALTLAGTFGNDPACGQETKSSATRSRITIIDANGGSKEVILTTPRHFEAPNWSPDGSYLLLNSGGQLWRLPVTGGEPQVVPTGNVRGINNDHGIAPDGKTLAISAGPIYVLPASGGEPRRVTEKSPSYFHGWSPDGKTLAYCARRGENFDLYAISPEGGAERRLTTHDGYDDGPDYSPDGRWIYFNSDRSGNWDIWRIPAEGAGPNDARAERITNDDLEDWFPHPSPDGKWLVFVSFPKGTKGHPANQPVVIRRIALPRDKAAPPTAIENLVRLFGGQGTINVNSWSPDSKRFAYVSYEPATTGDKAWLHRDIGAVVVAGDARRRDGVHTITGTLDIWGKADGFHFVHQPLDGDGTIVARVTGVENTNEHAKAGVMIRESLDPGARHATMVVTPVDGTQFLRRKEPAGLTTNTNPGRNRGTLPYWVKLVRSGDTFRAYESVDGKDWMPAGTDTVAMGKQVHIGLVASSHQPRVTNTVTLDHVTITPAPSEPETGTERRTSK
jgi:Tol biopolymer transport system component